MQLVDISPGQKLKNELMVEYLHNDINQFPFLYENK